MHASLGECLIQFEPTRRPTAYIIERSSGPHDHCLIMADVGRLPLDILSHIVSFTSPKDAARASAVSTHLHAASNSDIAWLNFLPPDLPDILAVLDPHHFPRPSSHKDLYLSLCEPRLVDGGRRLFWLDRLSGKKCYHLSARELAIVWGENHRYWRWVEGPRGDDQAGAWSSSFSEVAELLDVCWLLISAELDAGLLSHQTRYGAYLVLRLDAGSYGLTRVMPTVSVTLGDQVSTNKALLAHPHDEDEHEEGYYDVRIAVDEEEGREEGEAAVLRERRDGWLELELGEFFIEAGDDGAVKMELRETQGGHWKKGLIIHGIEIRPKTANP